MHGQTSDKSFYEKFFSYKFIINGNKFGFAKMTSGEFETYIAHLKIARTILFIQQHHTYIPSYIHFNNNNHFELQKSMKNTPINTNGWADIGQHFFHFS